ncbi:MAG TPA: putative LPS assembly protein LptD [Clostridiales bacterium]|nr:putative LPS assembly protein LptD [Clostridiales bacterium]HQP70137.1 putative LPS assembly protein LptD [Clostridiales bacterium]
MRGFFIIPVLALIFSLYAQTEKETAQPDTAIFYFADRIDYNAAEEKIFLSGNSRLRYKAMTFTAHSIVLDMKNNTVSASQKEDTLFSKTSPGKIDSIIVTGVPTISEGNESVTGDKMSYDLDTKQGKVSSAKTVLKSSRQEDDTYFRSGDMLKLENNDIHGINAQISSCDLPHQHYHFRADSIIVTQNNWVFAKPISLYFDEVPVAWFPFILYKNNKGRNSGFILPSYYYSSTKGNSFKHLGFFWDMTDYTDYTVMMDYYDRYGYLLKQNFRYKKKYSLDGFISADFTNDHETHDWRFRGVHNHKISPSMSLNASADYVTKRSLVRDLGETSADRMTNKLYSSGIFTKRWYNSGDNFRTMSSVTQYVDTAIVKYTFPNVSYSLSGRRPFADSDLPSVFKKFQYSGSFNSVRNVNVYEDENIFDENTSSGLNLSERTEYGNLRVGSSQNLKIADHKSKYYVSDTTEEEYENYNKDSTLTNYGINTASYLQFSHKVLRYFNLKESFNYKHDVAFRYIDEDLNIVKGSKTRSTYDLSANLDTKIYGIFQPEIGAFRKLRHTIAPSMGFIYYPDFSKSSYGYFVKDSLGNKKDIFSPSLIGSTPSSETMKLTYSLNNIFDAKIRYGENESSRTLFNLNFSGFYNFAADSNKMSVINARANSNIYNGQIIGDYIRLSVNGNANSVITPYTADGGKGDYINSSFTFWDKNPFRMESWDVNYSVELPFTFKGTLGKKADPSKTGYSDTGLVNISRGNYTSIPFDINGRVMFSERYDSNDNYTKNFNGNIGARISLTESWSVEYSATLNFLMPKEITSTVIKVARDMHCWQGEFEWDLFNKGFKLLINTKSSIFSDLKFDKDTRQRKW